jgi:polyisoprenoid-binding protein YceI
MLILGTQPRLAATKHQVEAPNANKKEVDVAHSKMTVHVYKSGLFSAFAHDHDIDAPIKSAQLTTSDQDAAVALHVDARKLQVRDAAESESTRAKIQATMLGAQVLDADRFPEILFQSNAIEPRGPDHWMVHGRLAMHGAERPIAFEVAFKDDRYRGSATLKQTDFGMTPVTIAGGSVKVKDDVRVEFEIALAK